METQLFPASKLWKFRFKLLRTMLAVCVASWVISNLSAAIAIHDFELLPDCDYVK